MSAVSDLLTGNGGRIKEEAVVVNSDCDAASNDLDEFASFSCRAPKKINVPGRAGEWPAPELQHEGTLEHELLGMLRSG